MGSSALFFKKKKKKKLVFFSIYNIYNFIYTTPSRMKTSVLLRLMGKLTGFSILTLSFGEKYARNVGGIHDFARSFRRG